MEQEYHSMAKSEVRRFAIYRNLKNRGSAPIAVSRSTEVGR